MNKIIEPISYKKMAESYAEPAYTYKKFTEGYGAGYEFNIYGLKLKNVKIKNVKKNSNEWGEWQSGEFEADIAPGEYQWDADHPMWSVKSPDYAEPVSVSGGKVYGIFEDADVRVNGGDIADTLQWEKYDLGDIIGGGWSHTNMSSPLELEQEERNDYTKGIDKSEDNSNYGYITKASIELDADYLNDVIYDAMNPEEDIFWGSDKYEDYDLDDAAEDYAEDFEDTDDEDIGLTSDARHPGQWYESKKSKGKKLKEDSFTSKVRQDIVDINAAKEQVNNAVEVLDKKVSNVTNNLVQIALNNRATIREAQTRFVELDSPINVSKEGQINENDAKKILRKLAADRNLRVNAHYSVRDSEGKETIWDFMKSQNPDYQYVFLMEMTGRYTWCNMLFLNKKRGKVDIKNTLWDSYDTSGYNKFYDKEEVLQESNRLTHKIVLKPENSGFRLTHADKLRFHSKEEAENKLTQMNASIGSRLASKGLHLEIEEIPQITKPRNTRTSDPDYENPFEVGDILEGDFGWSMILPVWVEVISKTNKMVTVRQLKSKVISHDGYGQAGTKMPIPGQYEKDWNGSYREKKCLVKKGYNRTPDPNPKKNYIIDYNGKIFQLWDGEASDFDTYD